MAKSGPWATCALTQLGFIRVSSTPAVVGFIQRPSDAAAVLRRIVSDKQHLYLNSLPPPVSSEGLDLFERITGAKQVSDAYLLTLARQHKAVFLTFDTKLRELAGVGIKVEVLGL